MDEIYKRQEFNLEILKYLAILVEQLPQQRFGQILSNYVLPDGDPFFEESAQTLKRVKKYIDEA